MFPEFHLPLNGTLEGPTTSFFFQAEGRIIRKMESLIYFTVILATMKFTLQRLTKGFLAGESWLFSK